MTTRDKQLVQTINHSNNTTAVMLLREVLGPDNQWWPLLPIDASHDAAAINAFDSSLAGSQQAQIAQLTTERDSLQSDYDAKVNDANAKQAQIDSLTEQVATLTSERDARPTQAQLDAANARIAELEAQLSPPNPFPDADWAGFRAAALTDPAVQRVAAGNSVLWPVLFMYLSELSTNPARGKDIAWLWNTMEMQTPVTAEEIQRVNAIAETHGVPLSMNAEGQIVLP